MIEVGVTWDGVSGHRVEWGVGNYPEGEEGERTPGEVGYCRGDVCV